MNERAMVQISHVCYSMKINKRAEESKRMIAQAFTNLILKDDYELITITQICQEAEICRNTFYRNFSSKEDVVSYLIECITNRIYTRTIQDVKENMEENRMFEKIYFVFFDCWDQEKELLSSIIRHNLYVLFSDHFFSNLSRYIVYLETRFEAKKEKLYQDYLQNCISAMLSGMLMTWAQHDFKESVEDLVKITLHLQHLNFTICNNTAILQS